MTTLVQTLVFLTLGFGIGWGEDVPTTSGILRGGRTIVLEKPIVQFLGVPYARPPVGILRFKPPVDMTSDTIARDASRYAPSCYQPLHLKSVISPLLKPNQAELSEDCLYLNVYVPEEGFNGNHLLPVMIWLPGEGFDYADPQQFDGSYLAALGNVIVVTVNYRVSVFGFLSTLTDDAPGNIGLLDQRMAMKWLQKNIARFGGDPENVTLFGRFTGSMSVGIHAFSPLSLQEKLFDRIILQSGVAVGDWVFENNPLNATLQLAKTTNCLSSSLVDLLSCLRDLPADILLQTALTVPQRWRPVYDNHLIYEDTLSAARKKNYSPVDVLMGVNSDEGSICTIALNAMHSPLYHKILRRELTVVDFQELVENNLQEIYKIRDIFITELSIHEYASKETETKASLRDTFVDFCGDLYVTSNVQKLADVLAARDSESSVYMYEFSHRPSFSIQPSFIKAAHGDDVLFSLGLPFQLPRISLEETKLTKKMVETITNFAHRGNPNGKNSSESWPAYSAEGHQIMKFGVPKVTGAVSRSSHDTAVAFWHEIIPTALTRSCPPSLGPKPFSSTGQLGASRDNGPETLLFDTSLTLVSSKYLIVGLIFSTVFLFVALVLAIVALLRSKRYSDFNRLR